MGQGAFYPPTVLTHVRKGMPAFDEEMFGPVAAVIPVKDEAEAIQVANDSVFGLGAAVFTRDIARGERIGTLLTARTVPLAARKQWLADHLTVAGQVRLDPGAVRALVRDGKSLLPIGVTEVTGEFQRGEVVTVLDPAGREVARGLANYSAEEARRIIRRPSGEIEAILGYVDEPELIHRDNLVLL